MMLRKMLSKKKAVLLNKCEEFVETRDLHFWSCVKPKYFLSYKGIFPPLEPLEELRLSQWERWSQWSSVEVSGLPKWAFLQDWTS